MSSLTEYILDSTGSLHFIRHFEHVCPYVVLSWETVQYFRLIFLLVDLVVCVALLLVIWREKTMREYHADASTRREYRVRT